MLITHQPGSKEPGRRDDRSVVLRLFAEQEALKRASYQHFSQVKDPPVTFLLPVWVKVNEPHGSDAWGPTGVAFKVYADTVCAVNERL